MQPSKKEMPKNNFDPSKKMFNRTKTPMMTASQRLEEERNACKQRNDSPGVSRALKWQ